MKTQEAAATWFRDRDELAAKILDWITEAFAPSAVKRNRRPVIAPLTVAQCAPIAVAALAIRDRAEGNLRRHLSKAVPGDKRLRALGSTLLKMIEHAGSPNPAFSDATENAPPIFWAAINAAGSHGDADPALFIAERVFAALSAANARFKRPRAPDEEHPACLVVSRVLQAAGVPMKPATVSSHLRGRRSPSPRGYVRRARKR